MYLNLPFIGAGLLVLIGIAIILMRKNLVKMIMGLSIVEAGINLFLVASGYVDGGIPPIFTAAGDEVMVYPTVQAMTLTNIVIGIATTALLLSFVIIIYRRYGTADVHEMRRLKG